MRKVLLFLLSLTSCLGMTAQTQNTTGSLSVTKTVELTPGGDVDEDEGYFTIAFDDVEDVFYTAYQMDIYLPDGFQFAIPEGFEDCALRNNSNVYPKVNREYVHQVASTIISDNHLLVLATDGSYKNKLFAKHSGDLFDVYVKATPYAKPGDFQISIKNIKFVEPSGTEYGVGYLYQDQVLTAGTVSAETSVPVKVTAANKISTAIFPISCDVPEGLEVYTTDGVDGEYIKLTKAESITAFTPYILYSENGIDQTLNGTIDAANYPASTSVSDGCITGVLADTQVAAGYVLQNKGEGPKFYKIGATPFKVPAGKCYANPASANAPALAFRFKDNETSGIHGVENTSTKVNNAVYDLQGKQVLTPQSGQIYIINGQKVLKR